MLESILAFGSLGTATVEEVIAAIGEGEPTSTLIMGMGNIAGVGMPLAEFFQNREDTGRQRSKWFRSHSICQRCPSKRFSRNVENLVVSIAVGLVVSLLFTEAFGLTVGGMIVPGYLALYLNQPLTVLLTIAAAFVTWGLVRLVHQYTILYGRRRVVITMVIGFAVGMAIRGAITGASAIMTSANPGDTEAELAMVIGYIIPGLIACGWIARTGDDAFTFAYRVGGGTACSDCCRIGELVMKTLYYRPKKISKYVLLGLAGLSLCVMALVECFPVVKTDELMSVKLDAARRAEAAMLAIGEKRTELNHPWHKQLDPAKTMMIGPTMSVVTTQVGHLDAKQTSVNPNFAAVVVDMLHEAGVKSGDILLSVAPDRFLPGTSPPIPLPKRWD